jgi:hypothetical protein
MRWLVGFGRLVRGLWPDRNPLRRRSDRTEAAVVALLLAGLLVGAPAAAAAAGSWTYGLGVRVQHSQQAGRHQVPATVLEAAPAAQGQQVQVDARWVAPDGPTRTGQILVDAGTPAGGTVPVWTDGAGRLLGPPLRHGAIVMLAVCAGIWAVLMVCALLRGIWCRVNRSMQRRRMTAWEDDWLMTGPRWTNRR